MFAIKVRNKIVIFCVYSRFGEKTIYSLLPISIYSQCVCVGEEGKDSRLCVGVYWIIWYYTISMWLVNSCVYRKKNTMYESLSFCGFWVCVCDMSLMYFERFYVCVWKCPAYLDSFKLKRNLKGKRCVGRISYSNYQEENKAGYTVFIYHTWLCTVQED